VSITEVIGQARYWAKESEAFCRQEKQAVQKPVQKWSKPEGDIIKINTDGAFDADERKGGWGFVARDSQGRIRGAGAGRIEHIASAMQSEAIACMEALYAASEWGMGSAMIETDSANLVRAVQCTEYDLAPEAVLFRDIRSFIRLNFGVVEVRFAPRECNKLAHALAAYGAAHVEDRVHWVDMVPDGVRCVAASESAEPI
jgi:ribonuclease HI